MGIRHTLETNTVARLHARQDMLLLCVGSPDQPDYFLADVVLMRSLMLGILHTQFACVTRTREVLRTQDDLNYYRTAMG